MFASKAVFNEAQPIWSKQNVGKGIMTMRVSVTQNPFARCHRARFKTWAEYTLSVWRDGRITRKVSLTDEEGAIRDNPSLAELTSIEITLLSVSHPSSEDAHLKRTTPEIVMSDIVENAPKLDTVAVVVPTKDLVGEGSCPEIGGAFGDIVIETTESRDPKIRTLYCKTPYKPGDKGHAALERGLKYPGRMSWNISTNRYEIVERNEPGFLQDMVGAFCVIRGEDRPDDETVSWEEDEDEDEA